MLNIEKIAKNIKLTEEKEGRHSAKYILEPLYRGYGNTIGNALRRILLSSIPGSAIKGLRIDGVLNEFSTIPGVKEAVTDIILNVKEIVVELDEPGEKKMFLSVKGPKVITAADIKVEAGIKIINPEQEFFLNCQEMKIIWQISEHLMENIPSMFFMEKKSFLLFQEI